MPDKRLDSQCTRRASLNTLLRAVCCNGDPEPYVVVAIVGRVVVAIRRPNVLRVVVPRPAAENTVGALCRLPISYEVRCRAIFWYEAAKSGEMLTVPDSYSLLPA